MMGVVGPTWKARTVFTTETETTVAGGVEEWILTREVILKVVRRFPDVMNAVREALHATRRLCPEELRVPS